MKDKPNKVSTVLNFPMKNAERRMKNEQKEGHRMLKRYMVPFTIRIEAENPDFHIGYILDKMWTAVMEGCEKCHDKGLVDADCEFVLSEIIGHGGCLSTSIENKKEPEIPWEEMY